MYFIELDLDYTWSSIDDVAVFTATKYPGTGSTPLYTATGPNLPIQPGDSVNVGVWGLVPGRDLLVYFIFADGTSATVEIRT